MLSLILPTEIFKDQVSTDSFMLAIFYGVATVCLLFVVGAVGLIDAGLVRRKNVLDTWIQKLACSLIAGGALTVIGYGIWIAQYYQALGVPSPISQALKDWWLFGKDVNTFSHLLDPATSPHADVYQVFMAFFVAYAMVAGALLHSAGLERVKAMPMYVISLVAGGLIVPINLYLTWGSVSPLTNRGVHDYIGIYSLYITVGVWALIIAWRAKPRLGTFTPDSRTMGPVPHNLGLSAVGVMILMFAAPFAFLGCGYIVPGTGYFGISLTESGFGIVVLNIFMSYVGGGLGGAIIAYKTRNPIMGLIGVAAGYIGAGACLDVGKPWEILVVSFIAPFVVWGTYLLLYRCRIDDKKIVPLALGGGVYGALVAGIVGWGDKTGGYFGLTGTYAPQHATITLGWQAIGVVVVVAVSLVSGLLLIVGLEKTIGLRVTEDDEVRGLDATYWNAPPPPYADHELGIPAQAGAGNGLVAGGAVHDKV
jgi:Amt family ammonium transporter